MSRTVEEIEKDINVILLSRLCCRDQTQGIRLYARERELMAELDQAKKEARDES